MLVTTAVGSSQGLRRMLVLTVCLVVSGCALGSRSLPPESRWPTEAASGIVFSVAPGWSTGVGTGIRLTVIKDTSPHPSLFGGPGVRLYWFDVDRSFFGGQTQLLEPFPTLLVVEATTGPVTSTPTAAGFETFRNPGGITAVAFHGSKASRTDILVEEEIARSAAPCRSTAGSKYSSGTPSNIPPVPGRHAVCV